MYLMMIYYAKPRFRFNELRIENGDIIIKHSDEIKNTMDVDLEDFYYESSEKNDYIRELLDIDSGYCPWYLKNIIKSLRVKDYNQELENVYDKFNEMIKEKWWLYLSLYKEDELVNIILKFGKDIWNIVKSGKNEIFTPLICGKSSYDVFMNTLLNTNKKLLSRKIDQLIQKIGIPVFININQGNNIYSIWNEFIYACFLLYIVKALEKEELKSDYLICTDDTEINDRKKYLKKYIIALLDKALRNQRFSNGINIINTGTNTKEVWIIYSVIPFAFSYVNDNYGSNAKNIEFIKADILTDELEDYREYLLAKTKNEKRKKEINEYSYTTLYKSYRRKKLNY